MFKSLVIAPVLLAAATMLHADPVLVTVAGPNVTANMPAHEEDGPGFFGAFDLIFENGHGFDLEALAALEQRTLEARRPGRTLEMTTYTGPSLKDVLSAAGAEGSLVTPIALDGYQAEISMDLIDSMDPILATQMGGADLPIGGFGPVMIVFPDGETPEADQELRPLEVWAVFFIDVS